LLHLLAISVADDKSRVAVQTLRGVLGIGGLAVRRQRLHAVLIDIQLEAGQTLDASETLHVCSRTSGRELFA